MTHLPRTRPSTFLRPIAGDDRRRYKRFEQHGMVVRLGSKLLIAHDVSLGGICLERIAAPQGSHITLTLMPHLAGRIDLMRSHMVCGHVVEHAGNYTHVRFERLSYTLAKFIIHHLAQRNGVEPYIFR